MALKKKKFFTVLSILVIFSFIESCTSFNSSDMQPLHIKMWSIGVEADATHQAFINAISAYNSAHKDVQIDITFIEDSSFKTQLQIAIAAGDPPDIFQTWGGGELKNLVDSGIVREIKPLSVEAKDIWQPVALGPSTFYGKHYAVPVDIVAVVLFVNKDLFVKYNVDFPTTWPKFIQACKIFRSAGIIPAAVGNKEKWPGAFYTDYLINRIGGQQIYEKAVYDQANGGTFNDLSFIKAWSSVEEAVNAGCFEVGVNGGTNADAGALLITGKAAMQLQGNWMVFSYRSIDKDFTNKNIDVIPFPLVDGGLGNPDDLMGGTGQAMAISSNAPQKADEALIEILGSVQFSKDLASAGLLPSTKSTNDLFSNDPLLERIWNMIITSSSIHLLYGTDLPPKLVEVYWNDTQQLFDLAITPEKISYDLQAAAMDIEEERSK